MNYELLRHPERPPIRHCFLNLFQDFRINPQSLIGDAETSSFFSYGLRISKSKIQCYKLIRRQIYGKVY